MSGNYIQQHKQPQGNVTRGKTAPNRLRHSDHFILAYDANLLRRQDADFASAAWVDFGYGREPITSLESCRLFQQVNPKLSLIGVEIDPERVEKAQVFTAPGVSFRLGGFNLPLKIQNGRFMEHIRFIRAFNVLRQYKEDEVYTAWKQLASGVLPEGLLLEGTSDPFGRVWVANLLRRIPNVDQPWKHEALVFGFRFHSPFELDLLQAVLPKNLIHKMIPGEKIYEFFSAWTKALQESSHLKVWGLRQWFVGSAHLLAKQGYNISLRKKWLRQGWLVWETVDYPDISPVSVES